MASLSTSHLSSVPRTLRAPTTSLRPCVDAFSGTAGVKLPAWHQACRTCLAVSICCCCWDSTVGGWIYHLIMSDFAHSCPQLHPRSSRPRHAWWTSLSLTIQHPPPPPPVSDSLSPAIHSVSFLRLSGCTAAGTMAAPHPLQSQPSLPLTFLLLCRELAVGPQLSLNGAIPPRPFSPQVPRPAPHTVWCCAAWGFLKVVGFWWLVCLVDLWARWAPPPEPCSLSPSKPWGARETWGPAYTLFYPSLSRP